MGVELPKEPNPNNIEGQLGQRLDGARNQHDVQDSLNLLEVGLNGIGAKETLDFLRKLDGAERNGVGADLTLGTNDNGTHFLELTSPYSQTPLRADITDQGIKPVHGQ